MDYKTASELIKGGRNGRKKLANNTYLMPVKSGIAVRLHDTDIVTIHPNNDCTLNTGGWMTKTTKERISRYSPVLIHQTNGIWYVKGQVFTDGMKVSGLGKILSKTASVDKTEKTKRKLDTLVRNYINGFAKHIASNGLGDPGPGDCWACAMNVANTDSTNPFGKSEPLGLSHLLEHFREKYYVPSLLFKAIQDQGYADPYHTWSYLKQTGGQSSLKIILRSYFRKRKPELLKLMMEGAK